MLIRLAARFFATPNAASPSAATPERRARVARRDFRAGVTRRVAASALRNEIRGGEMARRCD
jgi:hypothetical protein